MKCFCLQKMKPKKLIRVSSKSYGNSCGRCLFSPNASKHSRPLSATPNSCGFGGRHSVIGFPIGSPLQTCQNPAVTFSSGSSPINITRQRSSIDSAIELECIPSFTYDNVRILQAVLNHSYSNGFSLLGAFIANIFCS